MTNQDDKYAWELVEVLQKIGKDKKMLKDFLVDILTPQEYEEVIRRWQIIKKLGQGIPQRQIVKDLGISIATITRGSRMLRNDKGGFNQVLKKYYKK